MSRAVVKASTAEVRLLPLLAFSAASLLLTAQAGAADSFHEKLGDKFQGNTEAAQIIAPNLTLDALHRWNQIAINASGLDHTPIAPGETRVFGEQLGPGRASRAMAIVHIAIADAVTAIKHGFKSYSGVTSTARPINMDVAIAQAAHDTLTALFPSQAASFDTFLASDMARSVASKAEKQNGRSLGSEVAAAVLAMRADDGSAVPEPRVGVDYITSDQPGHWRQDPISLVPLALGAHWGECTPFVLQSASQFRTPPPPAMDSTEYTAAFNEVKALGGDGIVTASQRTPEQAFVALFWAYDGTPSLCAPPRLYNQLTVQIATQEKLDTVRLARLLALVNVAMADAGFSSWESKFHWDFWRPIGGVREADAGTGPSGLGDGNPETIGDPNFLPLGAPASNLTGPNLTPPFPSYPSGHATFGGAVFQVLRRYFGTDDLGFVFVSDEFNGRTRDNAGNVRPYMPRYYQKLSQAEEENGQSRIYLGIHWSFDKTEGIAQGRRVGDYVFDHVFNQVAATVRERAK